MIDIQNLVVISMLIFALSLIGLIHNRGNFISLFMCIELMLLSINTNFIAFSQLHQNIHGQAFVFFNLTVAAAESAIGLGLLIALYSDNPKYISSDTLNQLKG
ncbi:MAG: NADH-quinone oxidoreductase subunit NuoK [Legionellales bacterium]|nr:NADH-quinone oxidoreductase subunit NuoK [Legionellales bacterium]|tara:strand:+ start:172 stop:480 length:309 start_codon:yes stop_codon:yes gene_type:complete